MKNGKFIVFEGCEGAGKTSTAKFIIRTLKKSGFDVLLTHEPGGTEIGKRFRKILTDAKREGVGPRTELFLFLADRAEHVERVIKPALEAGKVVICDRFDGATFAYQGGGRGFDLNLIMIMNAFAKDNLSPDLYILFDLSPEVGLSREGKNVTRFEKEKMEFHRKVRQAYLKMAENDPEHWEIVDAEEPLEDVKKKVLNILKKRKMI